MSLHQLRQVSRGLAPSSILNENAYDENQPLSMEDEALINETLQEFGAFIIADEILSGAFEGAEDVISETVVSLAGYMTANGLINETSMSISNPKINFVRLNKDAQIARLRKIFILKLARKSNNKDYKKFKLGMAIKKKAMAAMERLFGAKATILAKKAWAMSKNHSKINIQTDAAKSKMKK